jgi:hypothetical protein
MSTWTVAESSWRRSTLPATMMAHGGRTKLHRSALLDLQRKEGRTKRHLAYRCQHGWPTCLGRIHPWCAARAHDGAWPRARDRSAVSPLGTAHGPVSRAEGPWCANESTATGSKHPYAGFPHGCHVGVQTDACVCARARQPAPLLISFDHFRKC